MTHPLWEKKRAVRISGEKGTVTGWVIDAHTPDTLPDIPALPAGFHAQVGEVLKERGITAVLMLGYRYGDQNVCFVVFGNDAGQYWDLQFQPLTVIPL